MSKQQLTTEQRKRAELLAAFGGGELADPFSSTIITSLLITAAVTGAQIGLSYLFAPRPKPQQVGNRSGDFQLTRSEQGLFINEIYGGDPGDGIGGARIGAIAIWTSGLRRHVSTTGGGGKGGRGGGQQTQQVEYDMDVALMWANNGPHQLRKLWANAESLIDTDFTDPNIHEAEQATLTGATAVMRDVEASRSRAVTLTAPDGKASFNLLRNNAEPATLAIFYYKSNASAGLTLTVNGTPQSVTWPSTDGVYLPLDYLVDVNDGGNTISVEVDTGGPVTLDYLYFEPGLIDPSGGPRVTGRLVDVGADDTYTQDAMPDPAVNSAIARNRYNGDWTFDAASGGTFAAILTANVSQVFYPGNNTQLEDPTIQAETDGRLGAGYTPGYRKRSYSVLKDFYLTRYGGVFPTFSAVLEHAIYRTWADICQQWCARVNLLTTDYDFTAFDEVNVRGLRVLQGPYAPRQLMEEGAEVYDCYFAEQYGQLVGGLHTDAVVAELTDADVGWIDAGNAPDKSLSNVDAKYTPANELPRRVTVRHVDAAKEWEFNTQTEARQIVDSAAEITIEGEWTLTPDEARAVAARQLYRAYIERISYSFTLSTKWAWLNPGNRITIETADGFLYDLRLTSVRGGIGLIECEAIANDEAVFTQPAVGIPGIFEPPPVPIAAPTVGALLDQPLLREGDATNNNGVGIYLAARALTGDYQGWLGYGLYRYRNNEWELVATGNQPATMGRAVGVLADWIYESGIDDVSTVDVDLYGAATLSSVTEAEMLAGANMAILGDEVLHFRSAVRQNGYPNRWRLTDFLRGVRGTEFAKDDHVAEERFVLADNAVVFAPLDLAGLNQPYNYKFVTAGQDLDDAALLENFAWTGATAKEPAPLAFAQRNAEGEILISVRPRSRVNFSWQPNWAVPDAPAARTFLLLPNVGFSPRFVQLTHGLDAGILAQDPRFPPDANGDNLITRQRWYEGPAGNDLRLTALLTSGDLVNAGARTFNDARAWFFHVTYDGTDTTVEARRILADGTDELIDDFTLAANNSAELRLERAQGEIRFYTWKTGETEAAAPFAISPVDGTESTLQPYFFTDGNGAIAAVRVRTGRLEYAYTLARQVADGLGTPPAVNTLAAQVWQENSYVGQGFIGSYNF